MSQILFVLLAIALSAVMAGINLYYGGSAMTKGATDADAAKVAVQASQIQGAVSLYQAKNSGSLPTSLTDLTGEYLKSVPVGPYKVKADSSAVPWTIDVTDAANPKLSMTLTIATDSVPSTLCDHVKSNSGVTCTQVPATGTATGFVLTAPL